jgi:metal-sulfur cluster biosynthetic enzyme
MQPDGFDQRADLGLGTAQQKDHALHTQATRQDREIEHQRRVGEHQLGEVDHDVTLGADRPRQRLAATALGVAILVTAAAEGRGRVIEVDDRRNLLKTPPRIQAPADPSRLVLMVTVDEVTDALRDVIDPELGLDFVELGLIYEVEVDASTVRVTYSLTSPGCPIGPQVSEQIEEFVGDLDGVDAVEPTMTFSPPWTPERMSEDAKFALGF